MKALLLLPLLALTACTQTTQVKLDQRTQQAFAYMCAAEPVAHTAFQIFAPGRVSEKVAAVEAQAHAIASEVCASPPADLAAGLVTVARALAIVTANANMARAVAQTSRPTM